MSKQCKMDYCQKRNCCPTGQQFDEYHPKYPENRPFPIPACYIWPSWGKEMAAADLAAQSRGWSS